MLFSSIGDVVEIASLDPPDLATPLHQKMITTTTNVHWYLLRVLGGFEMKYLLRCTREEFLIRLGGTVPGLLTVND